MNNAAKFTPGPWHIVPTETGNKSLQSVDLNGDGDYIGIVEIYDDENAELIASAPTLHAENAELRAVLKQLLPFAQESNLAAVNDDMLNGFVISRSDAIANAQKSLANATGGGK